MRSSWVNFERTLWKKKSKNVYSEYVLSVEYYLADIELGKHFALIIKNIKFRDQPTSWIIAWTWDISFRDISDTEHLKFLCCW